MKFKNCRVGWVIGVLICIIWAGGASGEGEIQGAGTISGDIFGKRGSFYHVFLSVAGMVEDNIFNSSEEKTSDFITVISPGIQLAFPATRSQPASIDTDTTTPGGLVYDRFEEPYFQQFQSYFTYSPNFLFYADNSDENTINHYAQASLHVNFRGGLSINLAERFSQDFDQYQSGVSTQTDTFRSNLINLIATYEITEKMLFRGDLSSFLVSYTDDKNEERNRIDNSASGYLYFKVKSKTALFFQYNFIDINYDEDSVADSKEHRLLAGMYWNITEKTRGSFRAGYGMREFDDPQIEDGEHLVFEANFDYQFTPKTSVGFGAFRRDEETPDLSYNYLITTGANAAYRQSIAEDVFFELGLLYRNEDYQGSGAVGRRDHYFSVTPSLRYDFRDWLSASVSFELRKRDSDQEASDYIGNILMLKLTFGM